MSEVPSPGPNYDFIAVMTSHREDKQLRCLIPETKFTEIAVRNKVLVSATECLLESSIWSVIPGVFCDSHAFHV